MKTLVTLLFTGICSFTALAQDHCWIKYDHDAAGNRIKRYWWCGNPDQTDESGSPKTAMSKDFGYRLYPVPATDRLVLTCSSSDPETEMDILDMNGKTIRHQRLNSTYQEIDVSQWSAGSYVLSVRTEDAEYTTTFAITR